MKIFEDTGCQELENRKQELEELELLQALEIDYNALKKREQPFEFLNYLSKYLS